MHLGGQVRHFVVHISVCSFSNPSMFPASFRGCAPLLLTGFALPPPLLILSPLHSAALQKGDTISFTVIGTLITSFGISTFTSLERILLCREDHLFKSSYLMCLCSKPISLKTEEHSRSPHATDASVSAFSSPFARPSRSIHEAPSTSKSSYHVYSSCYHFRENCFARRDTRWKSSSSCPGASVHACRPKTGHVLHAPLLPYVIFENVHELLALCCPTSALVHFMRCFLRNFADFSARSGWRGVE